MHTPIWWAGIAVHRQYRSWSDTKYLRFLRAVVSLGSGVTQSRLRRFDMQNTSCLYINGNLMYGVRAGGALGHIAGVANALVDKGYAVSYASTMPLEGLRF